MAFFFNFNTDSRINLCVRAQCLRYVDGKHQCYRMAFLDFKNIVFLRKKQSWIGGRDLNITKITAF